MIKELFLTLTPPEKRNILEKRQAKKQRLAQFFGKSVVPAILHIFQKIGNPIRKSQVDDFGKDDFIWARRNFLRRLLQH